MAFDPQTGKNLYYSQKDVRSLIGGLSMSRLHLLQGISGTGKTSLPKAFARAIGAGSSVVEVQAGWRDRQDLIGHFNAFEGRFYESEFLLALYKASCPQYKDSPFVVVLDEMNLSHPEQYFADLLSALEQDIQNQQLVLMSSAVESPPSLFKDGRILSIPSNVWFVGTANHDETTKDFADKTYDRAHVMELPRHRESFEYEDKQVLNPVSTVALQNAFEEAKNIFAKESKASYRFLDERLGEILGKRFRVGWGNRLERQMENYVPVVLAAGGSIGEATDHIMATKLLRKIRDRHDNRPDDIIALREFIISEWTALDKKVSPEKSLKVLGEELHRLGHEED
jgi:MoxR-like ATPase